MYDGDCKGRKDEKRSTIDLHKQYIKAYKKNVAIYGDKEELYDFSEYKEKVKEARSENEVL